MNKAWVWASLLGMAQFLAAAGDASPPREAQIPFADRGGIIDWQVVDTKTVLIEDRGGRWYRASLFGTCFDLPSATMRPVPAPPPAGPPAATALTSP